MRFLEMIWQDSVYALRAIRQKPVFAATAVLTLALAIGGNTAMFTVIRAVLLKPLAYGEPDRLVRMSGGETPTLFAEMKGGHSFAGLGAFTSEENITLSGGVEPEVLKGERVSASFLRILGVEPLRGRGFREDEDRPGAAPVAMISSELWQRRFSGDPQIVGKSATLGSTAFTIIGVLPSRFQFPTAGVDV
jgi:putative ABC transport system permease protein